MIKKKDIFLFKINLNEDHNQFNRSNLTNKK